MAKVLLDIQIDSQGNVSGVRLMEGSLDKMTGAGRAAEAQLLQVRAAADRVSTGMIVAGGAILAMAGMALKASSDFNKSMAEVSTLVDTAVVDMGVLKDGINDLATSTGADAGRLTTALYQAISAGMSAADAMKFLDTAARMAIGGVTDEATAVDGLTTVLNAWGLEAERTGDVSDSMFVAMKMGKLTIGELADSYKYIGSTASKSGMDIDELNAALAAITTQGMPVTMAARSLNQALLSMMTPTKEQAKLAKELGIELSEQALKTKGLKGVIDELAAATGGSVEKMALLMGSSEAARAALALTGTGAEKFGEIMDAMADKAGASGEAYEKMAATDAQALAVMQQEVKLLQREMGDGLVPVMRNTLDILKPMVEWMGEFAKTDAGHTAAKAAVYFGAFALALGGTYKAGQQAIAMWGSLRAIVDYFRVRLAASTVAVSAETAALGANSVAQGANAAAAGAAVSGRAAWSMSPELLALEAETAALAANTGAQGANAAAAGAAAAGRTAAAGAAGAEATAMRTQLMPATMAAVGAIGLWVVAILMAIDATKKMTAKGENIKESVGRYAEYAAATGQTAEFEAVEPTGKDIDAAAIMPGGVTAKDMAQARWAKEESARITKENDEKARAAWKRTIFDPEVAKEKEKMERSESSATSEAMRQMHPEMAAFMGGGTGGGAGAEAETPEAAARARIANEKQRALEEDAYRKIMGQPSIAEEAAARQQPAAARTGQPANQNEWGQSELDAVVKQMQASAGGTAARQPAAPGEGQNAAQYWTQQLAGGGVGGPAVSRAMATQQAAATVQPQVININLKSILELDGKVVAENTHLQRMVDGRVTDEIMRAAKA